MSFLFMKPLLDTFKEHYLTLDIIIAIVGIVVDFMNLAIALLLILSIVISRQLHYHCHCYTL